MISLTPNRPNLPFSPLARWMASIPDKIGRLSEDLCNLQASSIDEVWEHSAICRHVRDDESILHPCNVQNPGKPRLVRNVGLGLPNL
jgi:hypothetical protein